MIKYYNFYQNFIKNNAIKLRKVYIVFKQYNLLYNYLFLYVIIKDLSHYLIFIESNKKVQLWCNFV